MFGITIKIGASHDTIAMQGVVFDRGMHRHIKSSASKIVRVYPEEGYGLITRKGDKLHHAVKEIADMEAQREAIHAILEVERKIVALYRREVTFTPLPKKHGKKARKAANVKSAN